jgi:hypothetical protein
MWGLSNRVRKPLCLEGAEPAGNPGKCPFVNKVWAHKQEHCSFWHRTVSDMDVCRLMHYTCTVNKQAVSGDKSLNKHKSPALTGLRRLPKLCLIRLTVTLPELLSSCFRFKLQISVPFGICFCIRICIYENKCKMANSTDGSSVSLTYRGIRMAI